MRKLTYAIVGLGAIIGQSAVEFLRLQYGNAAAYIPASNISLTCLFWLVVVLLIRNNDKS